MALVTRREFLVVVSALLTAASSSWAQSQPSPRRIAILFSQEALTPACTSDKPQVALPAFFEQMRVLGYRRGVNVTFECRSAEGRHQRLDALASELVQRGPAVIVTGGAPAALAAKRTTSVIPIVALYTADPVGIGLVKSLSRPGGNVTGVSALASDYAAKALELLKEVVPGSGRVGVIGHATNPTSAMYRNALETAGKALGIKLEFELVNALADVEPALSTMRAHGIDALFVMSQPFSWDYRQQIVDALARHRLPAVHGFDEAVEIGGLLSYATSVPGVFRRGAHFVDRILRGGKPAEIPVEQPVSLVLAVNLKTAHALGLKIPQSVLLRADRVIE